MVSKRPVEKINIRTIRRYIKNLIVDNKVIVSNASKETYDVKISYYKTLIAFFNLIIAASLLSEFILYEKEIELSLFGCKLDVPKIILILLLIISAFLISYTLVIMTHYSSLYIRQKSYRDLNIDLEMISNRADLFFAKYCDGDKIITFRLLNDLQSDLLKVYKVKNQQRKNLFKKTDWLELYIVLILLCAFFVIFLLAYFFCSCKGG